MVLLKDYPEEKNTSRLALAILYFWKIISIFYYDYPKKLIVTSLLINFTLPMAKHIIKPKAETFTTEQKQGRLTRFNDANKCTKKILTFNIYLVFGPVSIVGKSL